MKKLFLSILCVFFCVIFVGCQTNEGLLVATISNSTMGLSTNYAIRVKLEEDKRVETKYVSLQIKSNKPGQYVFWREENGNEVVLVLPEKDMWYNITYLKDLVSESSEDYLLYEDFGTKMFVFSSNVDSELSFRVVCGNLKESDDEKVLVSTSPISKEFKLNVKKYTA